MNPATIKELSFLFENNLQLPELEDQNKRVNELFDQAQDDTSVTSDLSELFL